MCKKEEYDTGDITFKWKNKGSIEGIVNKWIISFMNGDDKITDDMEITKDSRPDLFRNFTNNQVQILGGYTFTSYPSDGLTVKLYYDEKKTDNLLIEKNIKFDQTKLTVGRGFLDKKERNDLTFQQLTEATVNTYKLYEYAFIMNKLSHKGMTTYSNYGLEIQWIKVDGVLLTSQKNSDDIYIKIDKEPKKDLDNMFVEDNNYAQWKKKSVINNPNGIELGDRVFTISKKNNKIEKIEISYYKPTYAPGWKITENSKLMIEESENRGSDKYSENVTYTYTIPDTAIKVDDTVSGGWSTWTGSNGETYFNMSKMDNNWVNINSMSGMSATLKGAGRQLDLTLEQCKSLCENEDECKSLEYIPMYTTSSGYSSPYTYCTLSKVLPTDENTKEWTRAEIHIKGSSS